MKIMVEHGRARVHVIELQRNGAVVGPNIITRAQLRIGEICLDTQDAEFLTLEEAGTKLHARLGLVAELVPADEPYPAHLTVFDGSNEAGLPWWNQRRAGTVQVIAWPACPEAQEE